MCWRMSALRQRHRAYAAVVERIQTLVEPRFQHLVLASVEKQVEHEGAVRLAVGRERERRGAEALAEVFAKTEEPFSHKRPVVVWYGMVPLLPPGPQSLRPGGGSWIGRQLSMLRLSP
jgi:hypothetical protein